MADDRTTGAILTPGQRDWLRGEHDDIEPGDDAARTLRHRIRQRVQAGIGDLSLLLWHLEDRDREKIFEGLDFTFKPDSMFGEEYTPTPPAIEDALAFFFQGYETDEGLERAVAGALAQVADKQGRPTRYEVTIESEGLAVSLEELKEGLDAGDLTLDDVKRLHAAGHLDFDAYLELRRWGDPTDERPPRDEE